MDPGVRQDGPRVGEWWVTPETASRDKIELRAMLAPEEDYIYKELGVRLSLGAGKKGWLWAALPTGGVAAAIPGSEHMPGQGWVLGRRIQINTTSLPTSPYSQIPRKIVKVILFVNENTFLYFLLFLFFLSSSSSLFSVFVYMCLFPCS